MKAIEWAYNTMPKTDDKQLPVMALEEVKKARAFHESFPQYTTTPLAKLDQMASYLGLGQVYVKDESYRFGLNAFKVLGGSFAMARYIAKETGRDVSELPYSVLTSDALREEFGQATFFTATDGNHGRGVAWAANKLRQKAVVHMPKGTTQTRLLNIQKEGAQVDITDMNYDDCVRLAAKEAAETPRGVVVQDTAWDGYEEIPAWIMQGYGTMAMEADEPLMCLFRLVSVPLQVLFRVILPTVSRRILRRLLLWRLIWQHVCTRAQRLATAAFRLLTGICRLLWQALHAASPIPFPGIS